MAIASLSFALSVSVDVPMASDAESNEASAIVIASCVLIGEPNLMSVVVPLLNVRPLHHDSARYISAAPRTRYICAILPGWIVASDVPAGGGKRLRRSIA